MAKDDAKKVFEHLEKAREASAPLKDPGLTKKIETAQEHIKKRVDPDKGSPKGVESAGPVVLVESPVGLIDPQLVHTLGLPISSNDFTYVPGPGNWHWTDKGWERIKDGIVGTCITCVTTTHYNHAGRALCGHIDATRFTDEEHAVSCTECSAWLKSKDNGLGW
jgi:hypothetical protein